METNPTQKGLTPTCSAVTNNKKTWVTPGVDIISHGVIETGSNPTFNEGVLRGQGYSPGITANFVS